MRKKGFCFAIGVLLFSIIVLGQENRPKILLIPNKYKNTPDGTILPESKMNVDAKVFWIVCSDRDDNNSYVDGGGVSPFKKMAFLEKFFVTGENGSFLHLYKYADDVVESGRLIKESAIDFGWAEKPTLLLWFRCIVNESRASVKAIANARDNIGMLYTRPSLEKAVKAAPVYSQLMFVYKQEGNSVLLGRAFESNYLNIQNDILGWVNKEVIRLWPGIICLRPNNDPEAYEERKNAGINASIFSNVDDAANWKDAGKSVNVAWAENYNAGGASRLIFPILGEDKNGITQTSYLSLATNGTIIFSNAETSVWQAKGGSLFFTSIASANLKQPVFEKVLYLHYEELNELIALLTPLTLPASVSDAREKMTGAFVAIVQNCLGNPNVTKRTNHMTAGEVTALVAGVPSENSMLKHSVSDFKNPKIVSDEEIRRLVRYMADKIAGLESVRTNNDLIVKFDWGIYYIVPCDMLP